MLLLKPHDNIIQSICVKTKHWNYPVIDEDGQVYSWPYHCDGEYSPHLSDDEILEHYSNNLTCEVVNVTKKVYPAKCLPDVGWIALDYLGDLNADND